ncbi:MAG: hypothetical protein Q4G03_00125 [Planctomycetia bacterium]|nr:hypothetical protein [Planctomycetia bacterium]
MTVDRTHANIYAQGLARLASVLALALALPIPSSSLFGADDAASSHASKIRQTAVQTPIASDTGAQVGRAKESKGSGRGQLVEELERLPNLNVRPDTEEATEHRPHGAKLLEVMPGVTKFSELANNPILNKPVAKETVDGYQVATYQSPTLPDATIQIIGANDLVEAIMINLNEPRSESDARKAFEQEIKDVRPIWVPDEIGNFREVFPEKGIAFVLEKGDIPGLPSNRVIQIVAETVKCEYFIMRAEQDLQTNYTHARDDAEHALLHDPNAPGAHWILAQTHLAVGDCANARKHIFKAIKLNDSLPQFHLTYIDVLIQAGEAASALRYMDAVRDSFVEHPLFAIEAVCLDSVLRRESASADYDGAISQGQRALKMLQTLYDAKPKADVLLAAKKLELRTNLSVAIAVARKSWKNPKDQEKAFEWLEAASEVAQEIDKLRSEESQLPTAQIDVYQAALEVGLEMPDALQIDSYAQKARASAELYLRKTLDEVSAASVRWRAGNALMNASRIYDARKDSKQAIAAGVKGLEYIQVTTDYRPAVERAIAGLSQLQLGMIYANGGVEAEAFKLFDQANELFSQIESDLRARDASRVGVPLATVASLYWKNGKREQAVDTLKRAVTFLEKGHEAGYVKDAQLYVPYSNLSTMCKGLKNTADAAKYKALADQYAPKK